MKEVPNFFKNEELRGASTALLPFLNLGRYLSGKAWIISSGLRTKEHNKAVGGAEDSAHLEGLAVDILCSNITDLRNFAESALVAGFWEIGLADDHIHLSIRKRTKEPILFLEK